MTLDRIKLSAQTVRENIAILEECEEPDDAGYYLQLEHEKFVLSALEKQIPKKPTPHIVQPVEAPIKIGNGHWQKGTTVYKCPNCGEWVSKIYKHCLNCGQALDWSDGE